MAAGDSDVSICNLALGHLGEDMITSRSPPDNTKRAVLCNVFYDPTRRAVLRAHPWGCAKKQANLAPITTAPLFDYGYAYAKPADYLRALDLPADDQPRWKVLGPNIVSDIGPTLSIEYIYDLQDPTQMDSLLIDVLAKQLAYEMCIPLTQSADRLAALRAKLTEVKNDARTASADEASAQEWDEDIWLRARR